MRKIANLVYGLNSVSWGRSPPPAPKKNLQLLKIYGIIIIENEK